MSKTTNETCCVPGCGKEVQSRGLCFKHGKWAHSADPAERKIYTDYVLPSARGKRGAYGQRGQREQTDQWPPADGAGENVDDEIIIERGQYDRPLPHTGRAASKKEIARDARVAGAYEMATALGAKCAPHDGGFLFLLNGLLIYVTPGGKILPAKVLIGAATGKAV